MQKYVWAILLPRVWWLTYLCGVLYLTRSGAIAADALVLILTWTRTFLQWRQLRRVGIRHSISALLLRDGTPIFLCSNMLLTRLHAGRY